MSILSERIQQEREYVGYSPAQMATKLGVSVAEYASFEDGSAEPTDNQLTNIARLCGTTPDRLRGEDLRADPRIEQLLASKRVTAEDAYEVHRFAEFLRYAPHPSEKAAAVPDSSASEHRPARETYTEHGPKDANPCRECGMSDWWCLYDINRGHARCCEWCGMSDVHGVLDPSLPEKG